jgi:hypothetical protein
MYQMQFSNNNSTWLGWEAYSTSKIWTLTTGDGAKTVYVQYKDNAGNISGSFTDGITLDTIAPSGTISVNSGATYTTSTSVTLTLSATDATSGIYQMNFSNDNATWSGWEAYGASKAWTLTAGDSAKTVYVQYKDNAGNISVSYSDGITLDATPPSGTIAINGGAAYTTSLVVTINLSMTDATSGMFQMRFSNDNSIWNAWEAYAAAKSWTLPIGDGAKTVYAQFKDNAGNTTGSITDSINLDMNGPTGSVIINGGAAYTTTAGVTLSLTASDAGSSVSTMRFSNDNLGWSVWEAYAASKSWSLEAVNGVKTVYVQYKDLNNNISDTVTDTIIFDNTAPTASAASPAHTFDLSFTVTWSGTDNASGIASYDVQYRVGSGGAWTDWLTGVTGTSAVFGPGTPVVVTRGMMFYFRARAHDAAGNVGSYAAGDGDCQTLVAYPVFLPGIMR